MAGQPGAASAAQGLKGAFKVTAAGKERKIIKWLVAVILILLTLVLALAPAAWQWHKAKSREEALRRWMTFSTAKRGSGPDRWWRSYMLIIKGI